MNSRLKNQRGFALSAILYMLGLIGVTAGVLFTGYSQIIRSNIAISDSIAVKNDLNAATQILAGSSKIGSDGTTLCPPAGANPGGNCSTSTPLFIPIKLSNLSSISSADPHLPTIYSGGNPVAITQSATIGTTTPAKEVGAFSVGSGVKQIDPWGHYYIYCRWENLTTSGVTSPAILVITAGTDGELETNCDAAAAATPVACNLKAGCDDTIYYMNVGTTVNHSTLWQAGTTTVGTSTLADVTYGASPLTVDANGNLTVPGTSALTGAVSTGTNVNVGGTLTGTSGGTLAIGSNTTVAGNLTTTGSVGIGTTGPSQTLEVNGTAKIDTALIVSLIYPPGNSTSAIQINEANGATNVVDIDTTNGRVGIQTMTPQSALDIGGGISVGTSYAGVTAAPANGAIIQGSVGIGTTVPAGTLDVEGGTAASSSAGTNINIIAQNGGATSGNGGNVVLTSGNWAAAAGQGKATITVGGGISATQSGGNVAITAGTGNNNSFPGNITLTGGWTSNTGGGAVNLVGGSSNAGAGAYVDVGGSGSYSNANVVISGGLPASSTTGIIKFATNNGTTQAEVIHTASAVDYLTITGAATGNAAAGPTIGAAGSDTNIGLTFTPKGTGNSVFSSGSVGIGTSIPSTALQVVGTATATSFVGNVPVNDLNSGTGASSTTFWRGDGTWAVATVALGTQTSGTLPVSDLSGTPTGGGGPYNQVYVNAQGLVTSESYIAPASSQWTTNGTSIYYNLGNVGIGSTTPVVSLDLSQKTDGLALPTKAAAAGSSCTPYPAGTIRYNTTSSLTEFCNGTNWQSIPVGSTTCGTPSGLSFTNLTSQPTNTVVSSNITTITFSGCGADSYAVSVSGASTALISINGGTWTTSGAISSGQTLQVQMTTSGSANTTLTATVTVGSTSTNWTTTTLTGSLKVFMTPNTYNGNLGDLAGADAVCQSAANTAGYSGTYKAIMSDSTTSAASRLILTYPIVNAYNNSAVASTNLWGGSISNMIDTPSGGNAGSGAQRAAWTGTNQDGSINSNNCTNWSVGNSSVSGEVGSTGLPSSGTWIAGGTVTCDGNTYLNVALYCIQQNTATCSPPSGFSFTSVTSQPLNTSVASNAPAITFSGCNNGSTLTASVTGPASAQISINGGAWTTSGAISSGQTLQVRMTTSGSVSTTLTATVTVGTTTATWSTTTVAGAKTIFLTTNYYGVAGIGSLSGADAICQAEANTNGYAGTFKAILSSDTTSAASRLSVAYPIVRATDGTTVVAATSLWGGSLTNAISTTAYFVWTGTNNDGSSNTGNTCSSWTSTSSSANGWCGVSNSNNTGSYGSTWLTACQYGGGYSCNTASLKLYCLQQ